MMGLVALIASSEQQLQSAAASGARLHSAGFATEMHVKHIHGGFLTVPPIFSTKEMHVKHIDARRSALNWEVVNCKKNAACSCDRKKILLRIAVNT